MHKKKHGHQTVLFCFFANSSTSCAEIGSVSNVSWLTHWHIPSPRDSEEAHAVFCKKKIQSVAVYLYQNFE